MQQNLAHLELVIPIILLEYKRTTSSLNLYFTRTIFIYLNKQSSLL